MLPHSWLGPNSRSLWQPSETARNRFIPANGSPTVASSNGVDDDDNYGYDDDDDDDDIGDDDRVRDLAELAAQESVLFKA